MTPAYQYIHLKYKTYRKYGQTTVATKSLATIKKSQTFVQPNCTGHFFWLFFTLKNKAQQLEMHNYYFGHALCGFT